MMNMARRWQNRTARQIVNYPANGFEARDVHQNHKPSKISIIPKKTLHFILLPISMFCFLGCGGYYLSSLSSGKNVYDVYSLSVDRRGLYELGKDAWIITQIKSFLAQEKMLDSLYVGVESFYGNVYIIGEFESKKELNRVKNYAKQTSGVRKVVVYGVLSHHVKKCSSVENFAIMAKVKAALFADKQIIGSNVHVHALQCKVIMLGIVQNDYKKERAQMIGKNMGYEVVSYIRALN